MREVEIFRAQGVLREDMVDEVVIRIRHEIPDLDHKKAAAFYASEGAALAEAIWAACPGGTIDALIAAMLARRASLFRVRFPKEPPS